MDSPKPFFIYSKMKLHRALVEAAINALSKIFNEGKHADDVVEKTIHSDKRWGGRDRRFVAETVYDVVRNYRLYSYCAASENLWQVVEAKLLLQKVELPAWEQFGELSTDEVTQRHETAQSIFEIKYSIPDALHEIGMAQLGAEKWKREIAAMHHEAKVCLRVNTIRTTIENAQKQLADENINTEKSENGLILTERKNIKNTIAYKSGWVEIQDENSQKAGKILNPQPGDFVVDACAGAGGKTLQLAVLMNNKGTIFATDVFDKKLSELQTRASRAGAKIVNCALMDFTVQNHLFEKADKLLLDVPCSGLGVLRRNPDTKWKFTAEKLNHYQHLQWEILSTYHTMLKRGGKMLYVTCSVLPSENEQQTAKFLSSFGDKFTLLEEHNFLPSETDFDGFYMALFQKK